MYGYTGSVYRYHVYDVGVYKCGWSVIIGGL